MMKRFISTMMAVIILLASLSVVCASAIGLENIYNIGDVNLDGSVNIKDVTAIQKHISIIDTLGDKQLSKADADYNGEVDVNDATHLQRIIASLYIPLYGKKGVDVSSHNGDIDFKKIKDAGFDFVMIRLGYGDDDEAQDDSRFESNVRKCEEAGLQWGAYIYSYALTVNEAKSEAAHTLRLLKDKKPTLPIAFDMEDADGYKSRCGMPSNAQLVNICKTYLSTIKDAGYYPMLYANLSWIKNKLNDSSLLDNYDIWFAQWNDECEFGGSTLGIWQYGGETNYIDGNSISGVGVIDKNFCYRDYPLMMKAQHYNGW